MTPGRYIWKVDESRILASGCSYTRYICTNVPRRVCVLELDLASTEAVLTTAYSDGIVPNPNANKNNNNGPKVRETKYFLPDKGAKSLPVITARYKIP